MVHVSPHRQKLLVIIIISSTCMYIMYIYSASGVTLYMYKISQWCYFFVFFYFVARPSEALSGNIIHYECLGLQRWFFQTFCASSISGKWVQHRFRASEFRDYGLCLLLCFGSHVFIFVFLPLKKKSLLDLNSRLFGSVWMIRIGSFTLRIVVYVVRESFFESMSIIHLLVRTLLDVP